MHLKGASFSGGREVQLGEDTFCSELSEEDNLGEIKAEGASFRIAKPVKYGFTLLLVLSVIRIDLKREYRVFVSARRPRHQELISFLIGFALFLFYSEFVKGSLRGVAVCVRMGVMLGACSGCAASRSPIRRFMKPYTDQDIRSWNSGSLGIYRAYRTVCTPSSVSYSAHALTGKVATTIIKTRVYNIEKEWAPNA
ncbi:hypothetical protein VNO77_03436 [Canavalia gladiata]|uniref:Uncharacterized protein n=1 Tax=Canavalia gladiata TaxID=3824 RepID=A0AAN9MUR0_CANGL